MMMMTSFSTPLACMSMLLLIAKITNAVITDAACTTGAAPNALAPNATNCEDQLDTTKVCTAIFKTAAVAPALHIAECLDPSLESVALQCAKTCKVCCRTPPFACGDDPASTINCAASASLCKNANWTAVMSRYCQGTCGLCQSAVGGCSDLNSGCRDMPQLCNDVNFQTYVQQNCQRTCGLCASATTTTTAATIPTSGAGTCADVATNCAVNIALCNNAQYFTLMTQKCARTCNRCSGTVPSTCVDSSPNCATWVSNGFCTNAFYTPAQRRDLCARSCNLC